MIQMESSKNPHMLLILLILLSFLIHSQIYLTLRLIPSTKLNFKKDIIELEIEDLSQQAKLKKNKKLYIKDFDLEQKLENLKKDSQFLSRKTRRVKKQSIAKKTGLTQNRNLTRKKSLNRKSKNKTTSFKKLKKHSVHDIKTFTDTLGPSLALKTEVKSSFNLTKKLSSSFSYHLPKIRKAEVTALNTDQGDLAHYTFNIRNYEKYYPRWTQNVDHLSKIINAKRAKYISKVARITELQLILDAKGNYVGHLVVKGSGDKMVDFTVTDALKRSTPFNNPPKDLVESDGLIYLDFRFRLEYSPRLYARDSR